MRKNKTTKSALISSVISLFLCVAMLVGTTFAWFTDSVTSNNNIIKSGNLDVELYYQAEGETGWTKVDANTNVFMQNTLWEPGHTELVKLKVVNEGSLALKYQLGINIASEVGSVNVLGKAFKLSDFIKYGVVNGAATYTRDEAIAAVDENATALKEAWNSDAIMLEAKNDNDTDEKIVTMVVYMPTTVGNEANYAKGEAVPTIKLGINLFATQAEAEADSFGDDYDYDAPIIMEPTKLPETGASGVASITLTGSVESKVAVEIPATVINGLDKDVTAMSIAASAPIVDAVNKAVTFKTIELIDQNGEEVDLTNATAKVTVTLDTGDAFADDEQVEIYHDGAFVTYATVAGGKVSYEVSHFCEVTVKAAEEVILDNTIDSVKEFIAFANAVNAGKSYAGETVVLGADLNLAGVTWTPIGTSSNPFKGTFNGNGKVIKNLSVLMTGKSDVGLFGYTTDGAVNNVTVENAKVAGRLNVGVVAGTPYTTTYTNVTVKGHVEVDGMAYVGAVGGKNAYANWTNVTANVDPTSYVNANSVENGKAYRTYVGGVVGFNGEGGHTFKNITSNINVFGSTCDVGGAFGIAHYGNKFENVTVTGEVTCTAETTEIGGIAGVWHNENGTTVTFTNCKYEGASEVSIVGSAYNATGSGILVLDGVEYVAGTASLKAQLEKGVVNLGGNINVTKNEMFTISKDKTVVINLNGYTISGTSTATGKNYQLFDVYGTLTVNGGTVTTEHTGTNMGWNNSTNVFNVVSGGTLTLNETVVKNLGGSDMAYAVNIGNNGGATLTTVAATLESVNYNALRVFNNADGAINVNLTEGTVLTGSGSPVFVHFWSKADLGDKQATRQAYLNLKFNDTEVSRYSGSKSLIRFGFTDAIYYSSTAMDTVVAGNETALKWALANGKNVILNNDIDVSVDTTAPYGNKYGIALNGGVIDGNGYALNFNAYSGDHYGIMTSGGTIKNLTITGVFRGIVVMTPVQDVIIDHVTINDEYVCYAINTAEHPTVDGIDIIVTNSTLGGWTSIAGVETVTFSGCTFVQGEYYTNVYGRLVKPYVNAVFENCEFESMYYIDLSSLGADQTVTLENCTVNDVILTANNWATLVAPESTCGEGQISIELKDGSYLTASNVVDYVIFK